MTASGSTGIPITLTHEYADAFPELVLPWQATEFPDPKLVVLNEPLATNLGLDLDWLRSDAGVAFLMGRDLPPELVPVAMGYAGHQFGSPAPRLGDGRALLLGELPLENGSIVDIHLKGSGATPFSRGGDGYAVLGPMLREFLISEAMFALGIATTRSLAVLSTGAHHQRQGVSPGSVLVRVAASHLRIGTFEYAARLGGLPLVSRLASYCLDRHYPEQSERRGPESPTVVLFDTVLQQQASLVAKWMGVGVIHGVMNTDNVTISGETIDYGPCAFMDRYDPATVFSSIDHQGRYAYGQQPSIMGWNLARFAESILGAFADDPDQAIKSATEHLNAFPAAFGEAHRSVFARKLGLQDDLGDRTAPEIAAFLERLQSERLDFTNAFREIRTDRADVNPVVIPRNHLADAALTAAEVGDLAPFTALLEVVRHPFSPEVPHPRYLEAAEEAFTEHFQTYCGT